MWLSKKMAEPAEAADSAEEGIVSVSGGAPAVVTDGELRDMVVVSPGGYQWQPTVSERVVVLRNPARILGAEQETCRLQPGEVRIYSQGAAIVLGNDGSIRLDGDIYINGERWDPHDNGTA